MPLPTTRKFIALQHSAVKETVLELGKPDSTFKLETASIPSELEKGQLLVQLLYLSNDPTQRGWIQKGINEKRLYVPPVREGEPMRSLGLAKVLKAGEDATYAAGDLVLGSFQWADYAVIRKEQIFNKIQDTSIPLHMYLDVLGMTGLTAYFGLAKIGQFKEGQSVIISAASGATGSVAVQLAKKLFKAKRVIAITGSESKCEYVKELGADVAINYHEAGYQQKLADIVGDDYVDCYFDLVGGEILDALFPLIKPQGRIIACGAIAGYNDFSKFGIYRYTEIITNRLTMQGFIVGDFKADFPEGIQAIAGLLKAGQLKTDSTTLTIKDATKDFEKIPQYWGELFGTSKIGKLLTKVADP